MKLVSRELVRAVRKRSLALLRQDKYLWKEYKRHRQNRFDTSPARLIALYAIYGTLVIIWPILLAPDRQHAQTLQTLAVAVYCSATAILRSAALREKLWGKTIPSIFRGLPIADRDFFSLQFHKFVNGSLWLLAALTGFYLMRAISSHVSATLAIAACLFAALMQWLLVCSVCIFVLKVRGRTLAGVAVISCSLIFLYGFFPGALEYATFASAHFLPAGWVEFLYEYLIGGNWIVLLALIPALAMAWRAWLLLRRIQGSFVLVPFMKESVAVDDEASSSPQPEAGQEEERRIDEAAVQREFRAAYEKALSRTSFSGGWIERIAGYFSRGRERVQLGFLMGGLPGPWTKAWVRGCIIAGAGIVLAGGLPNFSPLVAPNIIALGMMFALPLLGGGWAGFLPVRVSMRKTFVAALYPVSYWEVSRIILKINMLRVLVFVPILWAAGVVIGAQWGWGAVFSSLLAAKVLIILIAFQFVAVMMKHSQSARDTKGFNPTVLLLSVTVLIATIMMIGGAFYLLVPSAPYGWLIGGGGLTATCILFWYLYGLFYSRGRVDLIKDPDQ